MKLIVGLGNPGASYAGNRHNIGFMAADRLFERWSGQNWRTRFQGLCADLVVDGQKSLLLKPETFMNLSGQSVAEAVKFYKIAPENIIVIHDELDISPGSVRVKQGGGHGGHNGLKSIDSHIGQAYWRIRLGIGHPGHKDLVSGYVLHDFAKTDQDWLEPLLGKLADQMPLLLLGKSSDFAARLKSDSAKRKPGPAKQAKPDLPPSLSSPGKTTSSTALADRLKALLHIK